MSLEAEGGEPGVPAGGRRWIGALAIGVAVAGLVLYLFVGAERLPPPIKGTLEHRAALGGRDANACLSCHGRGTAKPRPAGHTGRHDCWSCHLVAQ